MEVCTFSLYRSYTVLLFNVNGTARKGITTAVTALPSIVYIRAFMFLRMSQAMCDLRPSVTYRNGPSKAVLLDTEYDVVKNLVDKTCSGSSDRDLADLIVRNWVSAILV